MFRALPIEGHKNIIQPAIFGVSRWLPFEGEKRNLSKWFSFALLDAYQMGEKFSKPFIKTAFSCSTTWGRKIFTAKARFLIILVAYLLREEKYIFSKGLIFGFSRDLPLEEENFEAGTTFDLSKWEQVKEYSKQGWKNWLLAAYSLREENFFENDSPNGLSQWE